MDDNPYNLPRMRPAKQRYLTALLHDVGVHVQNHPFVGSFNTYDSEEDATNFIEGLLWIDPTAAFKFIPYLCTLAKQLSPLERHHLMEEDHEKVSIYLAATDAVHSMRIPLELISPNGTALKPAALFRKLEPYSARIYNSPVYWDNNRRVDNATSLVDMFCASKIDFSFDIDNSEEQALLVGNSPAATLIAHTDDYKLVRINRVAAARFYGRNTQWCTAAPDSHSAFDDYNKTGSLFVLLLPKTQEKFQLHFGDEGFVIADKDDDTSVELSSLKDRLNFDEFYPKLIDAAIDDCEARNVMPLLPIESVRMPGQLAVPPLTLAQNERLYAYAETLLTHSEPGRRVDGLIMLGNRFFDDAQLEKYAQAFDAVVQLSYDHSTTVRMIVPDYASSGMSALHRQTDQTRMTDMIETLNRLSIDTSEGVRSKVAARVESFDSFHPKFDKTLAAIVYRLSHDDHEGLAEGVRNKLQTMSVAFQKKVSDAGIVWPSSKTKPTYPQPRLLTRQSSTYPA